MTPQSRFGQTVYMPRHGRPPAAGPRTRGGAPASSGLGTSEEIEARPNGTQPRSLGARTARGGMVVAGGQMIRIVIQIGSAAVLARFLSSDDYGLVAVVGTVVGLGEVFRDFGLSTAAIQARVLLPVQRNTLWWINTGIGATLTGLCFLAAPLVAVVYHDPQLEEITRWLALTFLLNGMTAQYRADLNRHMRFSPLVFCDIGAQVAGTALVIVLAVLGAGYWALVAQQLSAAAITLTAYMVACRWLPGLPRRGAEVKPFLRFGGGLVASQVVGYFISNLDVITLGLRTTSAQTGLYNRGSQLLSRSLGQLRAPSTSVVLPALSKMRDDRRRTDDFIVRGQLALGYTLVALTAFAAGAATPIVAIFLGHNWDAVIPVFALLAIGGACQTLAYVGSWVYLSRGLTRELFQYSLIQLAIKAVCIVVGSSWGIVGVAAGFATAFAIEWPLSLWWLSRITPMPTRRLYGGALRIVSVAAAGGSLVFGVVTLLSERGALVQLAAGLVAFVAVYALAALVASPIRRDMQSVLWAVRKAVHR